MKNKTQTVEAIRDKNLISKLNNAGNGQQYVMLAEVNIMLAEIKENYTPNSQIQQSNETCVLDFIRWMRKNHMCIQENWEQLVNGGASKLGKPMEEIFEQYKLERAKDE